MNGLLQTVVPVVLTALVAGQVAITRSGQLHSIIRKDLELIDKLPAGHPSRAMLETHLGELVDMLVRRQRRRFEPITRAGGWFGVNTTLAVLMVALVCGEVLQLTGVWEPEPLTRQDDQRNLTYYAVAAVCFVGFAVKAWWQQRREHPKVTPAKAQPLTGSEAPITAPEGSA